MATPARLAGVGAFVLGGIVLFALGLFMIGDRQMAFAKRFTVYTEFTKVTGLQPGAVVRVLGAKAGSIKQILPPNSPGEKFRVRLEVVREPASTGAHRLDRHDRDGRAGGRQLSRDRDGHGRCPTVAPDGTIAARSPSRSLTSCNRWAIRSRRSTRRSTP
jgi:hypothetical protein